MHKLSALIISHAFPPDMGGASNRAWNICQALAKRGHDVNVVAGFSYYPHGRVSSKYRGRFQTKETLDQIHISRVWIPGLATTGFLRRLLIYVGFVISYTIALVSLWKRRFDLVYYVSPYPLSLFSLPMCIYGRLKRCFVFLDVADLWPEVIVEVGGIKSGSLKWILVAMSRVMALFSEFITPITKSIRDRTLRLGMDERKVHVIELSVDTQFFKPQSKPKSRMPSLRGKFIVEYSGILSPKYDFATLLQAARIIGTKKLEILFVIRGDGEQKEFVTTTSKELGNVLVLGVTDTAETVVDYLNAADVLVCPMRDFTESASIIPSKVIEYFAVAKPVICSARGETEEVINAGGAGIIVPPEDPVGLADSILRLYEDRALCTNLGKKARRLAETRYSLDNAVDKIERLCRRAAS